MTPRKTSAVNKARDKTCAAIELILREAAAAARNGDGETCEALISEAGMLTAQVPSVLVPTVLTLVRACSSWCHARLSGSPTGVAMTELLEGTTVDVLEDNGSVTRTWTRSRPWQLGYGAWVVLLEDRAGGYSLERCAVALGVGQPAGSSGRRKALAALIERHASEEKLLAAQRADIVAKPIPQDEPVTHCEGAELVELEEHMLTMWCSICGALGTRERADVDGRNDMVCYVWRWPGAVR